MIIQLLIVFLIWNCVQALQGKDFGEGIFYPDRPKVPKPPRIPGSWARSCGRVIEFLVGLVMLIVMLAVFFGGGFYLLARLSR